MSGALNWIYLGQKIWLFSQKIFQQAQITLLDEFQILPFWFSLNSNIKKSNLRLPIWIQRGNRIKDLDILEYIKAEHFNGTQSVTVLCNDYCNGLVSGWCQKNGWKCRAHTNMIGSEDKYIVSLDCVPTFELISRARNGIIFVSFQGE